MSRYLGLHDGNGTALLVLDDTTTVPFTVTSVDLGSPDVRESTSHRTADDGSIDSTSYIGPAAVSIALTAVGNNVGTPYYWLDRLRGLCHPARRLYLHVEVDGWPARRRMLIRGAPVPRVLADVTPDAQFQWVAPDGWLEDVDQSSVTIVASSIGSGGIAVPTAIPLKVMGGAVVGATLVTVGGNMPTQPVLDLYGPCSDPMVRCQDTGQQIVFTGLTIAAGDYLQVDLGARTVFLNGDPTQSRYSSLDFGLSTWWRLPVGVVQLVFSPSAPSGACQAVITWRNRWI